MPSLKVMYFHFNSSLKMEKYRAHLNRRFTMIKIKGNLKNRLYVMLYLCPSTKPYWMPQGYLLLISLSQYDLPSCPAAYTWLPVSALVRSSSLEALLLSKGLKTPGISPLCEFFLKWAEEREDHQRLWSLDIALAISIKRIPAYSSAQFLVISNKTWPPGFKSRLEGLELFTF